MKVAKVLAVLLGILIVIGGLYCLFNPTLTALTMGYVVGVSMVMDAIVRFTVWWQEKKEGEADAWMLVGAILSAVFGFFILNDAILQLSVDFFIVYYIATWMLFDGILIIVHAFKIRRFHKNLDTKKLGTHWYLPLCLGILVAVFGVVCMFNPLGLANIIGVFIGLGVIFSGASLITVATIPIED